MQLGFGAGALWGTPSQDANGNAIANPTPTKFGVLQEAMLEIEFTQKELYGGNQFPVAIGRGQGKISGSAKAAQINGLTWAGLFFGQGTPTPGILGVYNDVVGEAIPATTPFTITVAPPSSGVFADDLGVVDNNSNPMQCVAATPTAGQYTVNLATGVYTFAAAQEGQTVFISYRYTATSSSPFPAKQTVISEQMGYTPTFEVDLLMNYKGQQLTWHLYAATTSKLSMTTKLEDFLIPEFTFSGYANTQGQVLDWSTSQ